MPRSPKPWWIQERRNPQLKTYYVALGRLGIMEAKCQEASLYGDNYMLRFDSEAEYRAKLDELLRSGARVVED
jgi:hypothetical protein